MRCTIAFFLMFSTTAYSLDIVWRGAAISSIVAYLWSNPFDLDELGFELGYHSERDITAIKLNNAWPLKKGLIQGNGYRLDSQLRFNIGFWFLGALSDESNNFPRHQRHSTNAELGVHFSHHFSNLPFHVATLSGMTYLSAQQLGDKKYGSRIGFVNGLILGYPYSPKITWNLSYLHYSNNDIARDNPPDNFIYLGYQHKFSLNHE